MWKVLRYHQCWQEALNRGLIILFVRRSLQSCLDNSFQALHNAALPQLLLFFTAGYGQFRTDSSTSNLLDLKAGLTCLSFLPKLLSDSSWLCLPAVVVLVMKVVSFTSFSVLSMPFDNKYIPYFGTNKSKFANRFSPSNPNLSLDHRFMSRAGRWPRFRRDKGTQWMLLVSARPPQRVW